MRDRLTIGVLVDWIDDAYHAAVLAGIAEGARRAGANLLCFAGGVLRSPLRSSVMRNAVFDLASPEMLDGLVVMGALGNSVGASGLSWFVSRYRPLPVVSIAVPLEGCPSVLVDNESGMREALLHLLDTHGRARVAFIRGPTANVEAEGRFRIYREVLEEREIRLEDSLVAQGDFERASGVEAARALLASGARFDALVAASDEMAIGAIEALRAHGVRVPHDVAVVGFDDVAEARLTVPSLTTVRQPLDEQGRRAAELLFSAIRGDGESGDVVLHTRLVARRSCGCASSSSPLSDRLGVLPTAAETLEMMAKARAITVEMADVLGERVERGADGNDSHLAARVQDAYVAELGGAKVGTFLNALEDALRARVAGGLAVSAWQEALSVLRHGMRPWLAGRQRQIEHAEELTSEARILVARYSEIAQAAERARAERLAHGLAEAGESLIGSFDRAALLSALRERLPRLGIPSAYLSVYRDDKYPSDRARLVLAFDTSRPGELSTGATFASRRLVPPGLLPPDRRWAFVIEPLFFRDDALGFLLLEMGPREGIVYEALRDHVSAAIAGAELVAKVLAHDGERQRLLRYVLDVTPDMHRIQPPADLFPSVLAHAIGMIEAGRHAAAELDAGGQASYLPPPMPEGFFAAVEGQSLVVRAGTGPFAVGEPIERSLDGGSLAFVRDSMRAGAVAVRERCTVLPLALGEVQLGVIYVEHGVASPPDVALLSTFANQASAAIRNMQLYEMAALDPLTGTHTRRFFEEWLRREVASSFRSRHPLSLLMIDTDGMKRINDTGGHLAGDEALATIGKVLRQATRQNDVVGRYGGDEFAVVLPHARPTDAEQVGSRILQMIEGRSVRGPAGPLALRLSVGTTTLELTPEGGGGPTDPAQHDATVSRIVARLIAAADEALYRSKRQGGMQVISGPSTLWE